MGCSSLMGRQMGQQSTDQKPSSYSKNKQCSAANVPAQPHEQACATGTACAGVFSTRSPTISVCENRGGGQGAFYDAYEITVSKFMKLALVSR